MTRERKWKTKGFDKNIFVEEFRPNSYAENINAYELAKRMVTSCDATVPRKLEPTNRLRCYWWNETLSMLGASYLRARRRAHRARKELNREEHIAVRIEYRTWR